MRKQLLGISLILFGVLLSFSQLTFDITVPMIDSIPWGFFGIASGVIGLIIVAINVKDKNE